MLIKMPTVRYPKARVGPLGYIGVHLRNPWIPAWWSTAFPGFGHLLLGYYTKGFLLIIWETIINSLAKINSLLYYSFTGQFELAKAVVDQRFMLLYCGLYVYAIWDSYRSTVELNKYTVLADREDEPFPTAAVALYNIFLLEKKKPLIGILWSALSPGLGHFYAHSLITGFFITILFIGMAWTSNLMLIVQHSFWGNFEQVKAIADPQRLLFLPSMYGFAMYSAYVDIVEHNKFFDAQQARYLKANFQQSGFHMPANHK